MANASGGSWTKRRFPRVPVNTRVQYTSEHIDITEETRDVSLGGLFLNTGLLDPVGTTARIQLYLPGREDGYQASGVVRWTTLDPKLSERPQDDRTGMGVEFAINADDLRQGLIEYFGHRVLPKPEVD